MKTETNSDAKAIDVQRLVRLDVLTPEFLYKALRPGFSWDLTADKAHWEGEARKLNRSLLPYLEANAIDEARPESSQPTRKP